MNARFLTSQALLCIWLLSVACCITNCRADSKPSGSATSPAKIPVQEPVPYRVYQRDLEGRAEIPVVLDSSLKDATLESVTIPRLPEGTYHFANQKLRGVPTGGPYFVFIRYEQDKASHSVSIGPLFVGDLWVLAGQSNMQGYGDLVDVETRDPKVMSLEMGGSWVEAKEPLHGWLLDPKGQKVRPKGGGLGLPFAKAIVQQTGIPIGLLPCAVGGTSMAQWDPAKKDEGRRSLYGSMLLQIKQAGGLVKGLLWYQGEAESSEANSKVYAKVFPAFINAVRNDLHQPDLPFYLVQLGRFAVLNEANGKYWNAVQQVQRRIPEQIANTAVVAAVDLELDDAIHVGTQGQKRLGHRLALVALREQYGFAGGSTPTLDKVQRGAEHTLLVKFKGVNFQQDRSLRFQMRQSTEPALLALRPARHIAGFSIRDEHETEIVAIFDARVAPSGDTVILNLTGPIPKKAQLWYGRGYNPDCNLTDSLDMAVPTFGPIPLDEVK